MKGSLWPWWLLLIVLAVFWAVAGLILALSSLPAPVRILGGIVHVTAVVSAYALIDDMPRSDS